MNNYKFIVVALLAVAVAACSKGNNSTSALPPAPAAPDSTTTSTSSSSGAMGVYTSNGATYALTPGSGASSGGQASLLTLPNSGNMVGAITVAQITKTPIQTTLTDAWGSPAAISGTSLDPANDIGIAFNYYINKISIFKLSTATELATFDTLTNSTLYFSGGSVKIAGAVMNPANKTIILATADGFEVVDYSNPAAPTKVREIASNLVNPTAGVQVMENFAFDAGLPAGAMIITGGGSIWDTTKPVMELVNASTGAVYRPDLATAALFTVSDYIDAAAVDTNYHVAILADESTGSTFVDLNQLTLNATTGTYTLPASAVSRITTYTKKTNLAIESTNHLVMMGGGYGGYNLVAAQLKAPSSGLGFAKEAVVTMPSAIDDTGVSVYWYGSYDPHGVGAYITPADHPTSPNTSLAIWIHSSGSHIATIDLLGVLDGTLAGGYDPTATAPKDISYFKIP